jgi:putative hydrolase of the HAD superfamily
MKHIKNIIFDLGGVLLDIDFSATQKAFETVGIPNFHTFYTQHHVDDLFEKLEIGAISPEAFYEQLRNKTQLPLSDATIMKAWNAMLLNFSEPKMNWLYNISKQYNVYLFSNTNKIHHDYFYNLFKSNFNGKELDSYFIKAWYSHEMGIRKPHVESFLSILKSERLHPGETLFIDDTIGNIEGAQKAGLHTLHLKAPQTVLDLPL